MSHRAAERATLSISEPNAKWIQAQIDSKEFSSRSVLRSDSIYYRVNRDTVEIMAILGKQRADVWL